MAINVTDPTEVSRLDGTLENEITIKLRELKPKLEKPSFENDSRWDILKDLK